MLFYFSPAQHWKGKKLFLVIRELSEARMGYYNLWLDFLASTGHGLPLADPAQHQAAFGLAPL